MLLKLLVGLEVEHWRVVVVSNLMVILYPAFTCIASNGVRAGKGKKVSVGLALGGVYMQERFLRLVSYIVVLLLMHFSTHRYLLLCFIIKNTAPIVTRQCLVLHSWASWLWVLLYYIINSIKRRILLKLYKSSVLCFVWFGS